MSKINISELKRIVKLANDLDVKGLHKEADLLDSVITGFKKMAIDATETADVTADTAEPPTGQHPTKAEKASVARQVNDLIVKRMKDLGKNVDGNTEPYKTLKAAYDAGQAYATTSNQDTGGALKTAWTNAYRKFYDIIRKEGLEAEGGRDGPRDQFGVGYGWVSGGQLYELWKDNSFHISKLNNGAVQQVKTVKPTDYMREDGTINPNSEYIKIIQKGYSFKDNEINSVLDKLLKQTLKVGDYNYNQIVNPPASERPPAAEPPPPADAPAGAPAEPPPAGAAGTAAGAQPPAGAGGEVNLRSGIDAIAASGMTRIEYGGGICYMMPSPQGRKKGKQIGVFVRGDFKTPLPYVIIKKTGDNPRIIREGEGWSPFGGISQVEKRQLESFKHYVEKLIESSMAAAEAKRTAAPPAPPAAPPAAAQPPAAQPPAAAPAPAPAPAANTALDSLTKKYSYFSKGIIRR